MKKIYTACALAASVLTIAPAFAQTAGSKKTVEIAGMPVPLTFVYAPAGSISLGTPAKKISLSAFYISAFETTWDQYNAFFQDMDFSVNTDADAVTRPSPPYLDFTLGMGREGFPANSMQQYGALMFCKWLYTKTGIFYRLPTEAEWEYACRAGTSSQYYFGKDTTLLKQHAWYAANSEGKYQKVGLLKPNPWGLYDMYGNVAEWTMDEYKPDYAASLGDTLTDPVRKPFKRHPRTVRGGTYQDAPADMQSASRSSSKAEWNQRDPQIPKSKWWNADAPFIGFRVIMPLKQPTAAEAEQFFNDHLFQ